MFNCLLWISIDIFLFILLSFQTSSSSQNHKENWMSLHRWQPCQEITFVISCFMLIIWQVDWACGMENCFFFPKLFMVNVCLLPKIWRNITLCGKMVLSVGENLPTNFHMKLRKNNKQNLAIFICITLAQYCVDTFWKFFFFL